MNKVSSQELSLLLAACFNKPEASIVEQVDWSKLSGLATWHRIRPQLLAYLHENEFAIEGQGILAQECQEITIVNLFLARELVRISKVLNTQSIECYAYKGILWADWLYGSITGREAGDIDLLVAPDDFPKALDLLRSDGGYTPDNYRNFLLQDPGIKKSFFATDYHLLLGREIDSVSVELHWQVAYPRLDFRFPVEEWQLNKAHFSILKGSVNGFSNEYQFLLLLVHHGGKEKWSSIKYIADFAAYMNRYGHQTNWEKVEMLARQKGISNLLFWSLGIIKQLGIEWKSEWPQDIEHVDVSPLLDMWDTMPKLPSNSTIPYFLQSFAMHDGLINKAKVVANHMRFIGHWRLMLHKARWYRNNPKRA